MKKIVLIALGVLLCVAGVLWTLQGLGYVGGSSMTGSTFWAIVGPVVAAAGVSLLYVTFRGPHNR
ncbi:conserved hypothetical protein [Kribbella flavida DSM 17836]|uniref:Integral membrane protein n=1 Tax=Kribbella flavida (strain DSM 17836 / JCM 10339 / NBRC 14399) TaxID=479435 RepID=D2Q3N4_KRIFD|nr:hypothetical protein [Kribbella flavida]ADB35906.1 conserved hypothetical protein [Kribbella flavida DSM 17836]